MTEQGTFSARGSPGPFPGRGQVTSGVWDFWIRRRCDLMARDPLRTLETPRLVCKERGVLNWTPVDAFGE